MKLKYVVKQDASFRLLLVSWHLHFTR